MNSTKSFLVALLFVVSAASTFAQREETVIGDNGFRFSGIWGGYTHQLSQFNNTNSYISGGFFGLEFGRSLFVGWGRHTLTDNVKWDQISNQNFDLKWSPLVLQYGIKNHKAIHPTIGFEAGRGKAKLENIEDRIFVLQPSVGLEINVFRWFRLGVDGGYRFVTDSSIDGLSDKALSGPYGQASLKFGFSWGKYNKKRTDKPKHYEKG